MRHKKDLKNKLSSQNHHKKIYIKKNLFLMFTPKKKSKDISYKEYLLPDKLLNN